MTRHCDFTLSVSQHNVRVEQNNTRHVMRLGGDEVDVVTGRQEYV